jgi:[acyl-carrier-protein] S-malonyltransferase
VIKANLAKQVISSVRWVQSVEYMSSQRVELFVEFGPQKVLGGMLKKIDRNLRTANLEKPSDLVDLKELINSL